MLERFLAIFKHPAPGLVFKEMASADGPRMALAVSHQAGPPTGAARHLQAKSLLGKSPAMDPLRKFYQIHDGADLCIVPGWIPRPTPMLTLLPLSDAEKTTERLRDPKSDIHWVIGIGESRRPLVESPESWIVFGAGWDGKGTNGFLLGMISGPDVGQVLWVAPQLKRNLAKSVDLFFARLGSKLGPFLASCGLFARLRGPDGDTYGRKVEEYVTDVRSHPDLLDEGHWATGRLTPAKKPRQLKNR